MSDTHGGCCLCGRVRFTATGSPRWVAHCHCESCRRATGAPVTTYASFEAAGFAWSGSPPQVFESSPGVRRRFCGHCGSPLTYDADRWPGEIHVHVSTLECPGDFPPRLHAYVAERIPWLELHDDLPRYREVGGRHVAPVGHGPARRRGD
jgi:hypothetical protein